jgi:hypothetical protein
MRGTLLFWSVWIFCALTSRPRIDCPTWDGTDHEWPTEKTVGAHPSPRGGQGPQLLQVLVQLPPIRRFPCHGSRRSGTANAPPSFSATDGYLAHADGCGQYGGGCEQERQLGRLESSAWPQEQGGRGDSFLSLVPPFRWCREFDGFLAPQAAARCRVACHSHSAR